MDLIAKKRQKDLEKALQRRENYYPDDYLDFMDRSYNDKVHYQKLTIPLPLPNITKSIGALRLQKIQEKAVKTNLIAKSKGSIPFLSSSLLEFQTSRPRTKTAYSRLPLEPVKAFSVSSFHDCLTVKEEEISLTQSEFLKASLMKKILKRATRTATKTARTLPPLKGSHSVPLLKETTDELEEAIERPATYHQTLEFSLNRITVKRSVSTSEGLWRKSENDDEISAWI